MIPAKNYKTVTKFVNVMSRIQWPLFSGTRCIKHDVTADWRLCSWGDLASASASYL